MCITIKECPTFSCVIYIAGNEVDAERAIRFSTKHQSFCASITPCSFIFKYGLETGVRITLITNPKYEDSTPDRVTENAHKLAKDLMYALCQKSCMIVTPNKTYYLEREDDK